MEEPISTGLPAFHTCSTPQGRYGTLSRHEEFESVAKPQPAPLGSVRAAFPECAVMVDEMRALFGEVTVEALREGDKVVKTKNYKAESEYRAVIMGEAYLRMGRLAKENDTLVNAGKRHAR